MPSVRNTLSAGALLGSLAAYPSAGPAYSDWAAPVNLGPIVNSAFIDAGPAISRDGLTLYFGSDRPGGFGGLDLWVTERASLEAPWGAPVNLGAKVNSASLEN